jgi:hypothetical protein
MHQAASPLDRRILAVKSAYSLNVIFELSRLGPALANDVPFRVFNGITVNGHHFKRPANPNGISINQRLTKKLYSLWFLTVD